LKFVNEILTLTSNYVCDAIAPALVCSLKCVNSFARRQHLFDIATTSVDVDSKNFVISRSFLCAKWDHLICLFQCLFAANFIEISSVFLRRERNTA